MAINRELLGPQSGEEEVFAIEALVFSVQVALQRAMNREGVSSKQLAERLGMTPARVSQIFSSSGPNLTLRTIARIAHALGEDFEFVRSNDIRSAAERVTAKKYRPVVLRNNPSVWQEKAANLSRTLSRDLAA